MSVQTVELPICQEILDKCRARVREIAKQSRRDDIEPGPIIVRIPMSVAAQFFREAGAAVQPSILSRYGEFHGLLISIKASWTQVEVI